MAETVIFFALEVELRSITERSNRECESAGTHSLVYLSDDHETTSCNSRNIYRLESGDKAESVKKEDAAPGGTTIGAKLKPIKIGKLRGPAITEDPEGLGESVSPGEDRGNR